MWCLCIHFNGLGNPCAALLPSFPNARVCDRGGSTMSRTALFPKSVIAAGVILLSFPASCAAFFSEGRAHPDSDYQILEFAHSKIETGVSRTLPWEFFEQIRPAVQPAIAYVVHRYATGPDPFTTVWLLRLASAALGFFSIWLLCGQALRWLNHGWSKAALVLFSGLFWLLPFLNTRFASESDERFYASE